MEQNTDWITAIIAIIVTVLPTLFFLFIIILQILMVAIGIAAMIFWILMLIDVVTREFPNPNDKLMWVLLIIFTHSIGALVYYFLVKKKKPSPEEYRY